MIIDLKHGFGWPDLRSGIKLLSLGLLYFWIFDNVLNHQLRREHPRPDASKSS